MWLNKKVIGMQWRAIEALVVVCVATAGCNRMDQTASRRAQAGPAVAFNTSVPGEPAAISPGVQSNPMGLTALAQAIDKGDESAIARYPAARGHADGEYAEALDVAIANALPRHPRAVLALLDQGVPIETLCTSPFIEPSASEEAEYLAKVRAALVDLDGDRSMRHNRDLCIKAIDAL